MAVQRWVTCFPLGQVLITPGALEALEERDVREGLARHGRKDWGDVGPEDWSANDDALEHGLRILSVYHGHGGIRFWVITEADRSATTVLLPDEY
jgi:hypothetical protein